MPTKTPTTGKKLGEIIVTQSPQTWTNSYVTLNVACENATFLQVDDSTKNGSEMKIYVLKNSSIKIMAKSDNGEQKTKMYSISNIDTEKPKQKLLSKATTSSSATLLFSFTDSQSGIKTKEYLLEGLDGEYHKVPENNTIVLLSLSSNTKYSMRLKVSDWAGNVTEELYDFWTDYYYYPTPVNPTPVNPTPVNPTPVNPTPDEPGKGGGEVPTEEKPEEDIHYPSWGNEVWTESEVIKEKTDDITGEYISQEITQKG